MRNESRTAARKRPKNKQDAGANNQGDEQMDVEQNSTRERQSVKVTEEVKFTSTEKNRRNKKSRPNQENPEKHKNETQDPQNQPQTMTICSTKEANRHILHHSDSNV